MYLNPLIQREMSSNGISRRSILSVVIGGVAALQGCTSRNGPDAVLEVDTLATKIIVWLI